METFLPLTHYSSGFQGQIQSLGVDPEWQRRLQCMGLRVGGSLEIFQSGTSSRPLVLICGNSRLVVDYSLGSEILVRPLSSKENHLQEISHE